MKRHVAPFGDEVVRLRPLGEADLETTLEWRNQEDVRIWFKSTHIIKIEQHRAWFEKYLQRDDDFVFVVEVEGKAMGQASVYGIDWAGRGAEVGRFIASPAARGKGYIRRACVALLRFCRDELGLASVFLEVKEDNVRAISIYVESGFGEVGRADGMIRMERSLTVTAEGSRDGS